MRLYLGSPTWLTSGFCLESYSESLKNLRYILKSSGAGLSGQWELASFKGYDAWAPVLSVVCTGAVVGLHIESGAHTRAPQDLLSVLRRAGELVSSHG